MQENNITDKIDILRNRLNNLEIEKESISSRLSELEAVVRNNNRVISNNNNQTETWHDASDAPPTPPTRSNPTDQAVTAVVVDSEPVGARYGCVDRRGVVINLGDKVYMETRGRFKERRGTVVAWGKKFLTIKDKTGREQTRIPRNVSVRNW